MASSSLTQDFKLQRKRALQNLHDAAQVGDRDEVRIIFETHKEFSINITRKGKNTILHTALFHNQEGLLLDYLIEKGADVNLVNSKGYTPLIVAITHCKEGVAIEKLVAAGANYEVILECGSFVGMSPLQIAEKYKNEKGVRFLNYMIGHKDKNADTLLEKKLPKNKALCPLCKTLVRYPTQMSRIYENQQQVEKNYQLYGEYGKKKKKSKVYTNRKYLDEFLNHADGTTWKKLSRIEFHAMENMALRKEISESYAVLHAVQECCNKLNGICRPTLSEQSNLEMDNLFIIDLCSGKGITSVLGAELFPRNVFLSIDKMLAHTVPHYFFSDEEHISYLSRDIFSNDMLHELKILIHQHTLKGRTTILVGMHCCGILSERAIELFESIPEISGIVLSPCCLPKKHEIRKYQLQYKLPTSLQKGEDPYASWCTYLRDRVEGYYSPGVAEHVWMYNDLEMHSQKNFMIVGTRSSKAL